MKPNRIVNLFGVLLIGSMSFSLIGCGGSDTPQKSNDFFTSGDREADQRADQRMAKDEELKDAKTGDSKKGAAPAADDANKSLYERLGGQTGIAKIVDDFMPRLLADPRVNFDRKGVKQGGFSIHHNRSEEWNASADNVARVKLHMEQFFALSTGGPSKYEGKEMGAAHANMHITNSEFDAALGDMKASLDKLGVAPKEQKELLAVIESTRPQIVQER